MQKCRTLEHLTTLEIVIHVFDCMHWIEQQKYRLASYCVDDAGVECAVTQAVDVKLV